MVSILGFICYCIAVVFAANPAGVLYQLYRFKIQNGSIIGQNPLFQRNHEIRLLFNAESTMTLVSWFAALLAAGYFPYGQSYERKIAAIFLAVVALAVAALTFVRSYPFGFARQEWTYRQKKAYAPETPRALLRRLVFDPHELVRWAVAQRNPLPEREIRQKLLVDRSSRVRGMFAMRPDLTNAEISRLLHDPVESVRSGLAQGPTLTQSQAIHLARDSSPLVRGWATSIPVLPASELQLLLSDKDENVRSCAQSAIKMRNQSPPIPYSSCRRSSDTGIVNDIIRIALPALEIQISCSDSERTIHALRDPAANWNVQIIGLHNDAWDAAAFSLAGIPARKSEETWDLLHTYPADTFASLAVTLLRVILASKDDSPTIQALR